MGNKVDLLLNHSGAVACARLHDEHLNHICVDSSILPICLQMRLPPAVRFADFPPLLVCIRQYWQPYLSNHSCVVVPNELQYWIKASEEKKKQQKKNQPNHCQEIGFIVSSPVSCFHSRNMVRIGLLIAQGQTVI